MKTELMIEGKIYEVEELELNPNSSYYGSDVKLYEFIDVAAADELFNEDRPLSEEEERINNSLFDPTP